mgnify:CR=1 FL=1
MKLGDTAVWPTDKARQLAREKLALVDQGRDPAEERDELKSCPTLAEVVAEHYLPHAKATKISWDTDETLLRCHVLPTLGERRLSAITTEDVAGLLNAMRSRAMTQPFNWCQAVEPYAELYEQLVAKALGKSAK